MGKRNYWLPEIPTSVNIYCLFNPLDKTIFYVGATEHTLDFRLNSHMASHSGSVEKRDVIFKIKEHGLTPEIISLDTVTFKEATFYEQFYMDLFRSFGFDICGKRKSNYTQSHGKRINNRIRTIKASRTKKKLSIPNFPFND